MFGSFVSIEPRVKLAGNDIHASVIDGYVAHGDPNGQQERAAVCGSRRSHSTMHQNYVQLPVCCRKRAGTVQIGILRETAVIPGQLIRFNST